MCLSVTCRYCVKTAKGRITHAMPRDSPGTLVFWRQQLLVGDPHTLWNLCSKWPTPFEHLNFDRYLLIVPQPWELAKKVQLALIGSRPRAFQRAISEPCTLPQSPPKGGTRRDFAVFASKIHLLSKEVCYKTSSGRVVATSFPYLMVHRWIACDVPTYLKFALKMTHPFRKCRFRQILLNSA